jgi:peptidoglycan hydrolase-like protein with peptidoglycan-binding domain
MRPFKSALATAVVVVLLAACGAAGSSTTTTTTTTEAAATTTTSQTTTTLPATTTSTIDPDLPPASLLITYVQIHLTVLGYFDGGFDGIPGPVTVAAIREFQTDAGVTVDGEFGPETQGALATAVQGNTDFIEDVQEGLAELGMYSGTVDGSYGQGTRSAVEELQESCDLEADGTFTVLTHICLDEALEGGD